MDQSTDLERARSLIDNIDKDGDVRDQIAVAQVYATLAASQRVVPQCYPLWWAEADKDGDIEVGRVVAWSARPDEPLMPVVAWEGAGRRFVAGAEVDDTVVGFLADTRDKAEGMAHRGRRLRAQATDGPGGAGTSPAV